MAALNSAQQAAVETLRGPLLVLAGAGTGKTRVVTYRIARLIQSGIAPDRILAVTFTNKAASEMRERVGSLLGRRKGAKPEVSTFHSLCVRILRRQIHHIGYPPKFAIYDASEQEAVAREVLRELRASTAMLKPSDLLFMISSWKSRGIRAPEAAAIADSDKAHLAASGYRRYQQALQRAGAVDFDDLLLCTEDVFTAHESVRREEAGRFDHILVDEYQDTNASQYRIVKALAGGHRNLCVVGDDDQSIYGWRGAEVEHILRFRDDWTEAKVVRLEENYRSTAQILQLANTLIRFNKVRHDKTLQAITMGGERPQIKQFESELDEVKFTVQDIQIQLRNKVEPKEIAILFRTNEQPRAFETELRRVGIPYILIGSTSFFDRKEVKDILSYLRAIEQPDDEVALRRIINNPPRGIGPKAIQQLIQHATSQGQPLWRTVQEHPEVAGNAAEHVARFRDLLLRYRARLAAGHLAAAARELLVEIDYQGELARVYDDELERQARWDTVEEMINALAQYESEAEQPSMIEYLDQMMLQGKDFESGKEKKLAKNAVALMTLHSAKGLEFPHVYLVGLEEGILPHKRSVKEEGAAIDEERRLCYVGITRAQTRLTLSLARSRMKWGKPCPTEASRFLWEMTGQADRIPAKRPVRSPHARPSGRVTRPDAAERPRSGGAAKPGASRPTGSRPAAGKPTVAKPTASRPAAAKPAVSRPAAAAKPTASGPAAVSPEASRPAGLGPAAARPVAPRTPGGQASGSPVAASPSVAATSAEIKPLAEQPVAATPAGIKPPAEQPAAKSSAALPLLAPPAAPAQRMAAEPLAAERPAAERPAAEHLGSGDSASDRGVPGESMRGPA